MKKLFSFILLLVLLAGCNPKVSVAEPNVDYEEAFQELLDSTGRTSFYSIPQEETMAFLAKRGDLYCEEDRCCGGNTIGWYSCFYKE